MKYLMYCLIPFIFSQPLLAITPGQEVAKLKLRSPALSEFILRGTFPIPPFIYPQEPNPFVIIDSDGNTLEAQTVTTSRYPQFSDGADVVEVITRVKRPSRVKPGEMISYSVVYNPHALPGTTVSLNAREALLRTSGLPDVLTDLLNQSNPLVLRTRDVFGNIYEASLLSNTNSFEILKQGVNLSEVRTYSVLSPIGTAPFCKLNPGSGCVMEHMMGVNAYITSMKGEASLRINLQFNNGPTGQSATNPNDDAVGKLYFDAIELIFPRGWNLAQQVIDPFFGSLQNDTSTTKKVAIVKPIHQVYASHPINALHTMDIFSQFHRRLALFPLRAQDRAQSILKEEGIGFATKGTGLFSWWNPLTARYYPQRFRLPSLASVSPAALNNMIENSADASTPWATPLNTLISLLSTGNPGNFPIQSPVLGWAHPHGETFGGGPGGTELSYWDGAETALSASNLGILRNMILHRMAIDRTPTGAFKVDGTPIEYDDWVSAGHLKLNVYNGRIFMNDLHWLGYTVNNFVLAPNYQQINVSTQCRYPYYDSINPCNLSDSRYSLDLNQYQTYDSEHRNRGWRMMLPLVWLANDSLAKSDVRMEAALFQLSFTQFPLDGGFVTTVSLRARENEVIANPSRGIYIGRYEGWGMQIASAAYSISSLDWRNRRTAWWNKTLDVMEDGQCTCASPIYCDGIMSRRTWVPFEWNPTGGMGWCNNINGVNQCPNFPGTQSFENDILLNGMWSMYSSVLERSDPGRALRLKNVILRLTRSLTSPQWWPTGNVAPWNHLVIGDLAGNKFCSATGTAIGFGVHGTHPYPYYDKNSLAVGYRFSSDPFYITKMNQMVGGPVKQTLANQGTYELGMTQALHAIAEDL